MANYRKKLPREFEQPWEDKPGQNRLARITRLVNNSDTRQQNTLSTIVMPDEIPPPNMSTIYGLDKNNRWQKIGSKCFDCGKVMSKPDIIEKHPLICSKEVLINKQEEQTDMPIHRIMKNGVPYYRWGDHGKLYRDRADAEKQAAAAHAAGYKEPKKTNK